MFPHPTGGGVANGIAAGEDTLPRNLGGPRPRFSVLAHLRRAKNTGKISGVDPVCVGSNGGTGCGIRTARHGREDHPVPPLIFAHRGW